MNVTKRRQNLSTAATLIEIIAQNQMREMAYAKESLKTRDRQAHLMYREACQLQDIANYLRTRR